MPKPTIAELKNTIDNLHSTVEFLQKENNKLQTALQDTLKRENVVPESDYDALLASYNKLKEQYSTLHKIYTADPDAKKRLSNENIKLKYEIDKNAKRHNERGAGRKRLPVEQLAIEYRKSGIPVKEIAEKLNVSMATVNRALNSKLRK